MLLSLEKTKMKIKLTDDGFTSPVVLTADQLQFQKAQLIVIDVRGWLEYVMGHIPGAQRLNYKRILKEIPEDQPIIVTCLSGHRSLFVAQSLVQQGYHHVHNLQGGVIAWQQSGYHLQFGTRP
jgi:hydroxyacylglutathione hydrolase